MRAEVFASGTCFLAESARRKRASALGNSRSQEMRVSPNSTLEDRQALHAANQKVQRLVASVILA
ncbi:MAG TPA: hypothetical protein DEF45_20030 [Rhodopirellula sp.]|nr:hypothetical protein [Rhodopirellula sp.]